MNPLLACEILVSIFLQVTVLLAVVWCLEKLTEDVEVRGQLWNYGFIAALVISITGIALPHWRIGQPWTGLPDSVLAGVARWEVWIGTGIIAIWLLGAGIRMLHLMLKMVRLDFVLRRLATPITKSQEKQLPISRDEMPAGTQIFTSKDILGPFCWQFHRPVIVLPESLFEGDSQVLKHVLLHEIAHLETRHPTHLFVQQLATVVLWFHPAILWAGKRAELLREFVCDQRVVLMSGNVREYLKTLLVMLERPPTAIVQCGLPFGERTGQLGCRTRRLMSLAGKGFRSRSPSQATLFSFQILFLTCAILVAQVWVPMNVLASPASHWSPWPRWSARLLHDVGVEVRDFEAFDHRMRWHELMESTENQPTRQMDVKLKLDVKSK